MNTLVLGNGFDIEHGLPTTYMDFLNYLHLAKRIYARCLGKSIFEGGEYSVNNKLSKAMDLVDNDGEIKEIIKEFVKANLKSEKGEKQCFSSNMRKLFSEKNLWYEYFKYVVKEHKIAGENWVDFEAEIADVVKRLESHEGKLVTGKTVLSDTESFMVDLASLMRNEEQVQGPYRKEYITRLEMVKQEMETGGSPVISF